MLIKVWQQLNKHKRAILGTIVGLTAALVLFYQYNHHPDEIRIYQKQVVKSVPPTRPLPGEAVGRPRLEVTWLGVSGFIFRYESDAILIDPFASREGILSVGLGAKIKNNRKLIDRWFTQYNMQDVKGVFVSHSHYDHSMDAPVFAQLAQAKLFGSQSTLNIGRGHKLPETSLHEIKHGQMLVFGKITVLVLESKHGPALFGRIPYPGTIDVPLPIPAPADAYRLGKTYSFVIGYPGGGSILHHGSADRLPKTLRGIRTKRVLLGIAGRSDSKSYIEKVLLDVEPAQVIPVHFDNFFAPADFEQPQMLWNVWMAEFLETLKAIPGAPQPVFLPLGKSVTFPD